MAKYCQISDITDSLIAGQVTDETLAKTDAYIDALLKQIGVDSSQFNPEDYPLLKQLAVYFASYLTCLELTAGENDVYLQKAKSYESLYTKLEKRLLSYGLKNSSGSTTPFTINILRG